MIRLPGMLSRSIHFSIALSETAYPFAFMRRQSSPCPPKRATSFLTSMLVEVVTALGPM